jgi:hypothetical protein
MTSLAVRRDLFSSSMPSGAKAALARVLDRAGVSYESASQRAGSMVAATSEVVKEGVVAGIAGGLIGAYRAKMGANVTIPGWNGADGQPVLTAPVEAVGALLGFGFAVYDPQSRYAEVAQKGAAVSLGILAARKMEQWLSAPGAGGASVQGDFGGEGSPADTIAAFARGFQPKV